MKHAPTMSRNFDVVMCLSCLDTENDDMSGASPQSIWHMAQVDNVKQMRSYEQDLVTAIGAYNIRFTMIVVSLACLQRCSRVCDSTVLLPIVSNAGPLQCAAAHEGHKVRKQVNMMGWQGCGKEHMLAMSGSWFQALLRHPCYDCRCLFVLP